MNLLVKELIQPILEDFQIETPQSNNVLALFGGGFKPPTKGHFDVVKQILKNYSDITEFQIAIGGGIRDGITPEMSMKIWEMYKPLLPDKIKLVLTSSPLTYIKDYIKENPNVKTYAVVGAREGDTQDVKDFEQRKALYKKYGNNVTVIKSESENGISGTKARKALLNDNFDEFIKYLPSELDSTAQQQIWSILGKENIKEMSFNNEQCGCQHEQPIDLKSAMMSLTTYMIEKDMNMLPLPELIIIDNDLENANNILGKTAHYNPSNCSITLFTLNRHPKDILRSYAHEMIHRIQDNEGRLHNVNTTNTNEDDELEELEKEAYLKGNITFRNWEDSIKNNINEWIVDIPKYNYAPKLSNKIFSQLHELKINEITLNSNNAVEVYGDLNNGYFTVGEYDYNYRIIKLDKNPYNNNSFYNIDFHEIGNKNPNPSTPTGNAKENYIKILSTMYKIILDFTQDESPEYVGISSLDESGYWNVYNNLIKTNQIPGYSRKDVGLQFKDKDGKNGKFIILKRTDV